MFSELATYISVAQDDKRKLIDHVLVLNFTRQWN
jgi:hypothetical protein